MGKYNQIMTILQCIFVLLLLSVIAFAAATDYPQEYKNPIFWKADNYYCFVYQETNTSCIPAAVQIVLKSFDVTPLPSQEQLAYEMDTNLNSTTKWHNTYLPFQNLNMTNYRNESISSDPDEALDIMKYYVSLNYPIIVDTYYNQTYKEWGNMTHARVITGYNETGVFFHDPGEGPNIYMGNIKYSELWSTDRGYWALIIMTPNALDQPIETPLPTSTPTSTSPPQTTPNDTTSPSPDPTPDTVSSSTNFFAVNLSALVMIIVGLASEKHFVGRLTTFANAMALDVFFIGYGFLPWYVIFYLVVGTIFGVIGLLAYLFDERLGGEYYIFTLIFYSSFTSGAVMLVSAFLLG